MKVLILDGGGREHTLAWKLVQSPKLSKLFIAPGNAGTAGLGENIDISPTEFPALENSAAALASKCRLLYNPVRLSVNDSFSSSVFNAQISLLFSSKPFSRFFCLRKPAYSEKLIKLIIRIKNRYITAACHSILF